MFPLVSLSFLVLTSIFVLAGGDLPSVPLADQVFDSYGDISWEEERVHLDNFAIELQRDPDAIGYIIAYAGRRACQREAQARATRARAYVINTRGIPKNRVKWIDGGYREKFTIVLQPVSRDVPAPIASPTVKRNEVRITKPCKPRGS